MYFQVLEDTKNINISTSNTSIFNRYNFSTSISSTGIFDTNILNTNIFNIRTYKISIPNKFGYKQSKILYSLNIYFIINKFLKFANKNMNI